MPLIIAVLLGLTAAIIVAYPLLELTRRQPEAVSPKSLGDVAERERQARQALREVELDYTLGNLESDDYDALRGRYERRALAALRTRYQREQELDALIERQLDALRAGKRAPERPEQAGATVAASQNATTPTMPTTPKPAATARSAAAPHVTRRVSPRDRRTRDKKGGQ